MTLTGKKILFVITKSNWGGAQQYVYTLALAARDAGAQVAVALGGSGEPGALPGLLAERLAAKGIRTIFLKSFARDISAAKEFSAFSELKRVIAEERPNVLHLNSSKAGGIGALAGRLAGVPRIIFTAHGWPHSEPRGFLSRALIRLASWVTVLLSHTVIVLSERQREEAPALFARRKLVVIGNGVADFPLLPKGEARTRLAMKDERVASFERLVLSTSELHPNKGLDVLIDAFARIAPRHTDTALVLMHGGDSLPALKAQAEKRRLADRVLFLGFVPEARATLLAADVFVLPSRKEGLPFGLLEAGRAGLPVVASHVGAIPEVVEDGVSGVLVPAGNVLALANALDEVLSDPRRGASLGAALRARIEQDYSERAMVERTLALY